MECHRIEKPLLRTVGSEIWVWLCETVIIIIIVTQNGYFDTGFGKRYIKTCYMNPNLGPNMIASRVCGTVSRIRTQMGDTYVHHTHVTIDNSVSQ